MGDSDSGFSSFKHTSAHSQKPDTLWKHILIIQTVTTLWSSIVVSSYNGSPKPQFSFLAIKNEIVLAETEEFHAKFFH